MASALESPTQRLAGRRVIVTGAAAGIGRATAQLFAREGATVGLVDRDEEQLKQVVGDIGGTAFPVDVTDDQAVTEVFERAATALGGIDGVVNAAGVMFRGAVNDVDAGDFRRVIDINLIGTYNVIRGALPWLQNEERATIVTIASAAGLLANAKESSAYTASKGGVVALTKSVAAEVAPKIRVNTVCPGMVDTAMADGVRGNVGHYALNRLANPEEIALALLFLTSDESSYVTGAALAVDGGRSFH